jgi:hypothetical protein
MSQAGLPEQQQLITALLDPDRYPHPVKKIRVIETHISWVLLAGRFAYKIKKALDLDFINTAQLEARRTYCHEELRLNRRLAPQLYLDVVPIGGSKKNPKPGVEPAIEYAVKMRYFAATNTLDHLINRDKITTQHIAALAYRLAHFHMALPAATHNADSDFATTVYLALEQNFSQLAKLLPNAKDELSVLRKTGELAFINCRKRLEERHAQGFVRECHGDLHLGNIALINQQLTPFDGIDFNPALRWIDVMDEVAFLFMDLLHHQRPALAYHFLNAYLELSGDYAGVELLNFYCANRAMVRAKVNAIRASQEKECSQETSNCRRYLALANTCLAPGRPKLIITHGLPGSGKSTFAQTALERFGAIRIRSDVERKRLFGLSALDSSQAHNIYSIEATQRTYSHLLTLAQRLLASGHSVIVDAAFLKSRERNIFKELAKSLQIPFVIISMQPGIATLRARIFKRQELNNDASEADIKVLDKLQTEQEALTPQEIPHTFIYTNEHEATADDTIWNSLEKLMNSHLFTQT